MYGDPAGVKGLDQCGILFVWDNHSSMPSRTTVNEVEYHVRVNEEQIGFHLVIERVSDLYIAGVGWARLLPLPAHFAGLAYFWYELQDLVRHSNAGQHFSHLSFWGMPPSNMELSKGEAALSLPVRKRRTTFPMSKSLQSLGFSGFVPACL